MLTSKDAEHETMSLKKVTEEVEVHLAGIFEREAELEIGRTEELVLLEVWVEFPLQVGEMKRPRLLDEQGLPIVLQFGEAEIHLGLVEAGLAKLNAN